MPRLSAAWAILLVTSFLGFTVEAQSSLPPILMEIADPQADQNIVSPAGNSTAPPGFDDIDLTRVWAGNESETGFAVGLAVAQWDPPPETTARLYARTLQIFLQVGTQEYRVSFFGAPCDADSAALAILNPGGGGYRHIACTPLVADASEGTVQTMLQKDQLLDDQGLPARAGTPIQGVHGLVRQTLASNVLVPPSFASVDIWVGDRAPNDGSAETFPLRGGGSMPLDFQLASPTPIRFSNGESTTMAFEAHLENLGSNADTFFLELRDLEPEWTGRVPPRLQLAPKQSQTVPVILSTEFTHRHGETGTFQLVAKSAASGEETDLSLGIRWADTPQPAGHHNVLYLHAKQLSAGGAISPPSPSYTLWINTLENDPDPNVTDDPVAGSGYAQRQTPQGPEFYSMWNFVLSPSLLMGLDFDLQSDGLAELTFQAGTGDQTTRVRMRLLYCDPGNADGESAGAFGCSKGTWIVIADGVSDTVTVQANAKVPVQTALKPVPEADIMAFKPSSNLRLQIEYQHRAAMVGIDETEPKIITQESRLTLPLHEYHEPIDQAFASIGALSLQALGPFEKPLNPGKKTVFGFTLANIAQEPVAARLSLEGHNAEWATFVGDTTIEMAPGSARTVSLMVEAPIDSSDGERAELFVVAEEEENPAVVAIARLRAAVTTMTDVRDETLEANEQSGTVPGPSFFLFVAVLIAATHVSRKRRAA